MSSLSFYVILYAIAFLYCLHYSIAGNNETDKLALLEIKAKITEDPLGVMKSWNNTLHFCEWHGVSCNQRHLRVKSLDLRSSKLTGYLSPFVGNLSFLRVLQLTNNSFGGVLPPEIGRLHRLESLFLSNNSIGGEIPSNISGCSSLTQLYINGNGLVGWIPPEIGMLSRLQTITLSVNNLRGIIPSSLGNLSYLSELYIARNNLVGRVPDSFGKLKNLRGLSLLANKLSGFVPSSIFNLTFMTTLDLGENKFGGNLPSKLGILLPNLRNFSVQNNSFTGIIPTSLSNSSNLEVLEMSNNNFEGQVPSLKKLERLRELILGSNSLGVGQAADLNFVDSLVNATMLRWLDIGPNNFKGNFPKIICNFSKLSALAFESNYIAGNIPICIENLDNLRLIYGWSNQLFGVVPYGIGKLQKLEWLDLSFNQLSGRIPSSIGNLTMLSSLKLTVNKFEGQVPLALANCRNLLGFDLSHNSLSGEIPSLLFSFPSLSLGLDLSHNHLTGSLPEEVGQLINSQGLFVSNNMLSGEIPSTLGSCVELELLFMENNNFHGTIPEALKTLKSLLELDLSRNNLSGEIPKFLASLTLQNLDLSYNNLEGEVPTGGVFNNASIFSVVGNKMVCGGIPELKLQMCKFDKGHMRKHSRKRRQKLAILFGLLGVVLMIVLFVSLLYTFWYKKRTKEPEASDETENFPTLSYQTLLKATNGFSQENLIGRGTFGVVYKGTLRHQDETKIVAIKIFNLEYHGASKSFMAECGVLRNIRHRNLVKVMTSCSSVDYQGNDFKALVYQYMENGNLEDWLRPIESSSGLQKMLQFSQRLDIAVDVALAVEYLHHHCGSTVVHCDLKPSNVLLDNDFVAHVSDFGLAKFLLTDTSNYHHSSSVGVKGTVGYAPPEYGLGNEVSTSGDVYSFRILLLELFTGKRPTDDAFSGGLSLHQFVEAALPDKLTNILDSALLEDIGEQETNSSRVLNVLISVLGIAFSCSSELPRERSDMSDVAAKLSSIRNKLLGPHLRRQRRYPAVV